jgi:hypothetical protein
VLGEFFITMFIFIAVTGVTLMLFSGWVAVMTAKGVGRLMGLLVLGPTRLRQSDRLQPRSCARCGELNPLPARFCRRCGRPLSL